MSAPDDPMLGALAGDSSAFVSAVREGAIYKPLLVTIAAVRHCNNRCVMCNDWRHSARPEERLSPLRMQLLLEELRQAGARRVNWSGGEPTIRQDLPELIGRLRDLGVHSKLTTNGTLLEHGYAERLRTAGLWKAVFSIESARPEIHDRVVGVQGAWSKLVQAISRLRPPGQAGPVVQFHTVLTALNSGPELEELVPLAAQLGAGRITLARVYLDHLRPQERGQVALGPEQVERLRAAALPRMRSAAEALGIRVTTEGLDGSGTARSGRSARSGCYVPFYQCAIDPDGAVAACCVLRDGPGRLGNIRQASLAAVLSSDHATALRRRLAAGDMPEVCARCSLRVPWEDLPEAIRLHPNPAGEDPAASKSNDHARC